MMNTLEAFMLKNKKGSVLITLIITMTIMAVLGAAMALEALFGSQPELARPRPPLPA